MIKSFLSVVAVFFFSTVLFAQTSLTGTVKDAKSGQPIPGANIKVVGKSLGTTTDFDGNFILSVNQDPPFTIEVSLIGFTQVEVEITQNNQKVDVSLEEKATALDEVVVSASRTPESILESPVTIERMDVRAIKNAASPSYYDAMENLKGVDVNTNSLTFKSVNTRGFATFANTRFMQLVDGMDNSSPALNFNLGNLLGMSELDVSTVELMPGASSALYGANAFNGILFMTSKNPFDSEGVSSYGKIGMTSQEAAGDNRFIDAGVRFAHKFSDKFAAKASLSFLNGTEWYAVDYGNTNAAIGGYTSGSRADTDYNGLNVYGDEVSTTLNFPEIAKSFGVPDAVANLMTPTTVSRTGYNEVDLMDYEAESVKADFSLNYRPLADDLEIVYNAKFGKGNTIYQGANRYSIDNFFMQQHKLEVRNDNFFVRAYVTDEDAGDSYDSRFTAININRRWKSDQQWFTEYAGAYINTFVGTILGGGTPNSDAIHQAARGFAQMGALVPGTPEFISVYEQVIDDPDLSTGSKFKDNTKIYHSDANYNFSHLIDFADIQVGGSWRQYSLNSQGTIFTDYDGPIDYDEYGAYTQIQKKMADDRLKFTGSIRYDKAKNFDGYFSPRISVSYALGSDKTRNLRASFQTGFRNPTTQDQYIGLDAGAAILVGSAPDNLDRYTSAPLAVSATGQQLAFLGLNVGSTAVLSGREAYENSFTLTSVLAGTPQKSNFDYVKPEQVSAFEVGYRAIFGSVSLDVSGYFNDYKDFIGNKTVLVPLYGKADFSDVIDLSPIGGPAVAPVAGVALTNGDFQPFQIYTNSKADIQSYGGSIGVSARLYGGYNLGVNYTRAQFDFDQSSDPDYEAGFNTPENKAKLSFGNAKAFENFGFNLNLRWNDEYLWESTFLDATIPSSTVIDAQVNYSVPEWKSTVKIGGTNIGGKEYFSAPGTGHIGSLYYVSWTINP